MRTAGGEPSGDISAAPRDAWRLALCRFLERRSAQTGLVLAGIVVVSAVLAHWFAPFPDDAAGAAHVAQRLRPPDAAFWLGTDHLGRDVLSRLLFGARTSLLVASASVVLSATIGTALGMVAGYAATWLDEAIMRGADIFLGVPSLLLAALVALTFGGGIETTAAAIAVSAWPRYARLVRGEALRIRVLEFVEAARAYGAEPWRIMSGHIFPGVQPALTAQATLQFGNAMLISSALGFLGLGARPPSPEWGLTIAIGREYLPEAWWVSFFPGAAILVTVVAFNLLGDALRVALDARAEHGV